MKKTNDKSFIQLTRLIRSYGYNSNKLVAFMPYARGTMQRRLNDPSSLTVYDIVMIARHSEISWDEISEVIGSIV